MATTNTFTLGDESIDNRQISPTAAIEHSKMEQRVLAITPVPATVLRVWDAMQTTIGSPASDDLGIITNAAFGSNPPVYVGTGDLKAAGSTTRRCAFIVPLPNDYEDGQTVLLRFYAGMITTVADVAATLDVEAYRLDKDGTVGASDLYTGAALTINSLTVAAKDFSLTPSTLQKGDAILVRVSVLVNDAATLTAVIGAIHQIELLADLR